MSLYTRIPIDFATIALRNGWVAVEEELDERESKAGLVLPSKKQNTIGRVLLVGCSVKEDVRPGDEVIYQAWEGGRWQFGEGQKCLLMDEDKILAVIREEE
jgi:co-chaperonin GroES (HSP10)